MCDMCARRQHPWRAHSIACSEFTQSTRGALGAFLQSLDITSNRLAKSLYCVHPFAHQHELMIFERWGLLDNSRDRDWASARQFPPVPADAPRLDAGGNSPCTRSSINGVFPPSPYYGYGVTMSLGSLARIIDEHHVRNV